MSLAAMHWARQSLKTLPATVKAPARLALMLLADYADEQHACWPSITTMAEEMGCSVRSVQRAVDLLEEHGLVMVEVRHATNGRQMSNRYHLGVAERFEVGRQSDTPSMSNQSGEGDNLTPPEGDNLTGEGDTGDRGRVTPVSPLESTTVTLTPSLSDAGANDSPDWFGESLTDDGQPLGDPAAPMEAQLAHHRQRQQPMTLDWEPDEAVWQRACFDRGLPVDVDCHLALIDFRDHFAALPGRTATPADWTRRFARWVQENLRSHATTGGDHRENHRSGDRGRDGRRRVRESLANPHDTSWADGWWPEEPGCAAQGAGAGAGEPGVHPAGGAVSEDLGERVSERSGAGAQQARDGHGAGQVAGAADPGSDRAGHERSEARGEYLAADDPGADQDAGADPGGLRYAGCR